MVDTPQPRFSVWMRLADGSEHLMTVTAADAAVTFGDLLRAQRGVENVGINEVRVTRLRA